MTADGTQIRTISDDDSAAVLGLLRSVMGWDDDDRVNEFFRWKHHENHFGPSPGWVGTDENGVIVAVRLMMRWRFSNSGRVETAVRAVDTATHPSQQGRGWFTRLTMQAVKELTESGTGFVFNTPNDKSRPGYIKMGWVESTTPSVQVRPRGPLGALKLVGSRVPAEKWAAPVGSAELARDVIEANREGVAHLLETRTPAQVETERTPRYLSWRYGLESLGYQAQSLGHDVADGLVIYRVRRRGNAREASICELLVPDGSNRSRRMLVKEVLRDSGADYALAGGEPGRSGLWTIPRIGPRLTLRDLAIKSSTPHMRLGDLELF